MDYIRGASLPLSFDANFELWYPIVEGDSSLPKKVGSPITLDELLNCLEIGDTLTSDRQDIEELEKQFPNSFIPCSSYWSSDTKIQFAPI